MAIEDLEDYLNKTYPRTTSFWCGFATFLIDAITLFITIGISFFIVNIFDTPNINFKSFINYMIYVPFILLLFGCVGLYPGIMISPTEEVRKLFFCTLFSCFAIVLAILLPDLNQNKIVVSLVKDSDNVALAIAFGLCVPFGTFLLPAAREVFRHLISRFKWWGVPAVIYAHGDSANFILDKLIDNKYLGYHPALIIDSSTPTNQEYRNIPIFAQSEELNKIIKKHNIKQAVICDYKGDINYIMSSYRYTISINKNQAMFTSTQQLKDIAGIMGFASVHNLTFKTNIILKRTLDIAIILLFSPIVIPIFLILAILTKLTSKGPIFYGHQRVGKNGKTIKCWKFRSMCINSQEILEKILETDPVRREEWEKDRKFKDDPRITKFGKFLRKTSLDELPQLFNVFIGQMSLVGPRPVTEPELDKYGEYKDYVLSVLPGLSGMWQISGRSDTGYEDRISFDTYYIQNWSIWLDIWILIKTIWVVLIGKGAC